MKKNQDFKALVAKMEAIKETEQGKLKGGITTLPSGKVQASRKRGNFVCHSNFSCGPR